jgi:hypothetical protein
MIPVWQQEEVLRMVLDPNISQKQIARILEMSRSTVSVIIRRGKIIRPRGRRSRSELKSTYTPGKKCPTCEHIVPLPCVACAAEKYARRSRRLPDGSETDLQSELSPDEEERRLAIWVNRVEINSELSKCD